MPQPRESEQRPNPTRHLGRRLIIIATVLILLVAASLALRRDIQAWWGRRTAQRLLDHGAVTAAQQWVQWAARVSPRDGRTDLLRATCYRRWQQNDLFDDAIRSARENGAPSELIERENRLMQISMGNLPQGADAEIASLLDSGASAADAYSAMVLGLLRRNDVGGAKQILDRWAGDFPDDANVAFMEGVYWRAKGDFAYAQDSLETAVRKQPQHELARTVLADLLEAQGDLDQAVFQRVELEERHPGNEANLLNLSRLLRKTGRADDAREVVAPLAARVDVSADAAWELGEVALALGDYQEAALRFEKSRLDPAGGYRPILTTAVAMALENDQTRAETLLDAVTTSATAVSLNGDTDVSGPIFEQINAAYDRIQFTSDLRSRLTVNPSNAAARRDLMALASRPVVSETDAAPQEADDSGASLYRRRCAACHGDTGGGDGRAARHLYPRPKNFRLGNIRLVSTLNRVPSPDDLVATIQQGMPGTSMTAFDDLNKSQLELLAQEVLRFYREGMRNQLQACMLEEEGEVDEEILREDVEALTVPADEAAVPAIGPPGPESIARGRQVYERAGCAHCHGQEGSGPSDTLLVDDEERLTTARDLAHEPFKGGEQAESVYMRILLGMPGTPHPACVGLSQEEMADLVLFSISLRRPPLWDSTNHERMNRASHLETPFPAATDAVAPRAN